MSNSEDPPLLHIGLTAGTLLVLLVGGTITFGDWGTLQVRLVAGYALGAVLLHGASRYVGAAGMALRAGAWLTVAAGAVHSGVLLRPEVLIPIAALAALDLALARTPVAPPEVELGDAAKITAGLATLAAVILVGALVLLALDALILTRISATVLVAWGLLVLFSMRPALRTTGLLLGGAGTVSLTFLLLTAPVIPFGPLLAYWVTVATVALAVVAGTLTSTGQALDPARRRHAQRVRPLPDPVIAEVREQVRSYLATGTGARALSQRIEQARGRDEGGRLLPALAEAQARGAQPSRADRMKALAEVLDVTDPEPPRGQSP